MIKINSNYPNYDGIRYYTYEYELSISPEKACDNILKDIDCTKVDKNNNQLHKTTDIMYEENCYKYLRHLFRIKNPIVYNIYLDKLIAQDKANKDFESIYIPPVKEKAIKKKSNKKTVANKYVRSITYDMFTNEERYLYENFKTGDCFLSEDPNLLESLNNKPKHKETVQTITLKLKRTNSNIQGNVKI